MPSMDDFSVRFWGVRGSIPRPGSTTVRYGGNTPCLEMRCGDRLLIFDAGTGLHVLGQHLLDQSPVNAHLFVTHSHLDHISGLPFFAPAYDPANAFSLWGNHGTHGMPVRAALQNLMQVPLFPVPLELMQAQLRFVDFAPGETLSPAADIEIRTASLNHPGGAIGYRVDYQGKSICYLTDTEHYPDRLDMGILELIRNADIVIYDATYTDEEYPAYRGWGHSTWQEGVKLCQAAGVRSFVAFHHAPEHDDDFLDHMAAELYQAPYLRALVAREGMALHPALDTR